jgi:hypothetical protein
MLADRRPNSKFDVLKLQTHDSILYVGQQSQRCDHPRKNMNCIENPLPPVLALIFCALLAHPSASATVIYQHNFSGSSETPLNGLALDTANGEMGGTANATWQSHPSRYYSDGTITSTNFPASAYVPFVPVSGYQYTITASVDITSSSSTNWIALSLFQGTPETGAAFNKTNDSNFNTYASIGRRYSTATGSTGTDLLRWQGPSNGGVNFHVDEPLTGVWNISILLDTSDPTNWTFKWYMQGDNNTQHLTQSYNLGTTSISHVMISNTVNVSADLSGFSITAVPEPSLGLLSSLAGILALRRTRRS